MLTLNDTKKLSGSEIINEPVRNIKFSGAGIDSRSVKKTELFIAIKGENRDAHDYVKTLTGKVKAAVVNRAWYKSLKNCSLYKDITLITVDDTTIALGELARNYRRKFLIPVIAVAGSNGKTTTRDVIANVLSQKYNVLKTEGNKNNQFGVPLSLFRLKPEHRICVLELGTNHFGEIKRLCEISEPQFGLITNIAKEHLEFLKDLKGVLKAEGELIDHLKKMYGTFFLNLDDKLLQKKAKGFEKLFTFGSSKSADLRSELLGFNGFYPDIRITHGDKEIKFRTSSIGYPAYYSSVCAAAIGFYFRIPAFKIKQALSEFKVITAGRNELKRTGDYWLIDDSYNSNPDSVKAALDNLKEFGMQSRSHIVLSDMLELGKSSLNEHYRIGKLVKNYGFENLYTYGRDSAETYKGAKGLKNNMYFEDKDILYNVLIKMINKDDIILVKGSHGMRMEIIVNKLMNITKKL